MKTYLIKNHAPGLYSLSFFQGGFQTEIALSQRETIFLQLIFQNVQERLDNKAPGAELKPAWGNSNLN